MGAAAGEGDRYVLHACHRAESGALRNIWLAGEEPNRGGGEAVLLAWS